MESHNHPSYIEPFQGAATGVGGIVRDIISMGARPVAVMDQLRFGALDEPDTHRVVHGVVGGISFYGNCLGLPNIGGETVFDPVYQGNPLVNALCLGVLRHEDLHLANATGAGNVVVLFGARTGGDGIGGASILASDTFSAGGPTKRPAVQVGDPFAEKVLIECCLELFQGGLVEAIQDLGAAGISCATSELAANGDGGMRVDLDAVLLRDPTLTAEEILMSESQERMMAIVAPDKLEGFLAVTRRWEVETSVLGEVTDTGRLEITWRGETIVDVDPTTVAVDGPVYDRPVARPGWLDALQADSAAALPRPEDGAELRGQLLALLGSPNLADVGWITDQYDRYVLGNTALSFPDDAGMIRVDEESGLGVAIATDANGRYSELDPYAGAQLALAEAYRNVAVTGARPLAVTRLPELRGADQPRGDVAVRADRRRAVRGLPRARGAGHRRQRLALQPDRGPGDPPDPGGRRARRDRRRREAHPVRLAGRRPQPLPARPHGARARRIRVGAGRARASRRPAARRPARGRARPRRAARRRRGGGPAVGRARPVRGRPRGDPRRGRPALRRRRAHLARRPARARRDRRRDGPVQRVERARAGRCAARGGREVRRSLRRPARVPRCGSA